MLAFATSAVRDAVSNEAVLAGARRTGQVIAVLSGEDEARLTFLAVRRWFGWSAGRLRVRHRWWLAGDRGWLRRGAGRPGRSRWVPPGSRASTSPAGSPTRRPSAACAARSRRHRPRRRPPDARRHPRPRGAPPDVPLLARICGAAPSADGPLVPRSLPLDTLTQWIPKLVAMSPGGWRTCPASSPSRSHQVVPGRWWPRPSWTSSSCPPGDLSVGPARGVILERLDQMRPASDGPSASRRSRSTPSPLPRLLPRRLAGLRHDRGDGRHRRAEPADLGGQLSEHHGIPIAAVHAPCLLFTQRVWGTEPWGKARALRRDGRGRRRGGGRRCTRRSGGRRPTPPASSGHRGPRGVDRHRLRRREHAPVAGLVAAQDGDVPARLGPLGGALRQHRRSTSPRRDPHQSGSDPDGPAARRPAATHPPHRRDRVGQDEHTWSRARNSMGAAPFLRHLAKVGFGGEDRRRISTRKCRGRRAGPTCEVAGVRPRHSAGGHAVTSAAPRRGRRPEPRTRARRSDPRHGRCSPLTAAGPDPRGRGGGRVDAALVHHYFGTKDDLFIAALSCPSTRAWWCGP